MDDSPHILDQIKAEMANQLRSQREVLRDFLAPKRSRRPFTEQLSRREALEWWRAHIDDEYGKQALQRMDPLSVIELHQALSQAETQQQEVGDGLA